MKYQNLLNAFNFAYGPPQFEGAIKEVPDDFCVEESLGFELTGEGEHLFILIEKSMLTTEETVKFIGNTLGLPIKLISYAGLKDKYAKTKQWFSLHLPGLDNPPLDALNTPHCRVIKAIRHHKKLKIGALKENHFVIRVHDFQYDEHALNHKLETIKQHGVPNYFGPQRFGHQGGNLERAEAILLRHKTIKNRSLRGIYYSAARSFLFNQIVSLRVQQSTWNQAVLGDLMMLSGTHSVFHLDQMADDIPRRVREHDIFPSAALWGKGQERLTEQALDLQNQALAPWQAWCEGLEDHGLQKAYRSMVLLPENLQFKENVFSFTLPKGAFATTVLREILVNKP